MKQWQEFLLSSSMPLEHEASGLLISKGFAVSSSFKHAWDDNTGIRHASIDLHARTHTPFSGKEPSTARIDLMVVCKHRHRDTVWLFLPDLNRRKYSPVTFGQTIRIFDYFSPYTIASKASAVFDARLPISQKGIEIDLKETGLETSRHSPALSTFEGGEIFRESLVRLQFVLPRLITENTLFFSAMKPENNLPFIFCPILLTTSRLFVVSRDLKSEQIAAANDITEIADEVPYLIMYEDYGPDFEILCKAESRRLEILQRHDKTMLIEQKRARYYNSQVYLPYTLIEALVTVDRFYLDEIFTQFIICTNTHFPEFVDKLKKTVASAMKTRRMLE